MAKLVIFEGADRVGKCVQSTLLEAALRGDGFKAVRVEPAKETHPRGRKLIYGMLETGAAKRHPNTFQLVQFLNRIYFQLFKLPALLRSHDVVILDRWALSGYVYGRCEGINEAFNTWMFNRAKRPDVTLILLGTSYKRATTTDDSYEKDTELQDKVKQAYLNWGIRNRRDHVLVDNTGTIQEVHKKIIIDLCMNGVP